VVSRDASWLVVNSSRFPVPLDDQDTRNASLEVYEAFLEVYKTNFEAPFINATEKYYTAESEVFLQSNTTLDSLRKAEERLREEEDWAERHLNRNTRKIVRLALATVPIY